MGALPAWRIATSALCATFLVGIACPAALAAEPVRDHSHAASPGARLPGPESRLEQLRKLDEGAVDPLLDLMNAARKAENGELTAAEARKVAAAAKQALAEMIAKVRQAPATPTASPTPTQSATATGVLPPAPVTLPSAPIALPSTPVAVTTDSPDDAWDTLDEALDAVEQAVDDFLEAFDPADEASGNDSVVPPSVDNALTELDDLIEALNGNEPSEPVAAEPSTLPSLWPLTSVPSLSPVTLPAITSALLDS